MSADRFRGRYLIPSIRMQTWDYQSPGWYFITICTQPRIKWFGQIKHSRVCLSEMGSIVHQEWSNTAHVRNNIVLDAFIVMPDHIHGIIGITHSVASIMNSVETSRRDVSTTPKIHTPKLMANSLGSIINQFKSVCTKRMRNINYEFRWQPRYYERLIRSNQELDNIRQYILNNPKMG